MAYGVTEDGFSAKTFEILLTQVEARARELHGAPNLDIRDPDGFLANTYLPCIEELATLWEVAEIVYNILDPLRSTRQSFGAVGELRGVTRKPASVGAHPGVTMAFDDAVAGTIARGDIRFNVEDQPDNVWMNSEAVTVSGAGDVSIEVESELPGASKILLASAVIEVLEGPTELTGITIPTNATAGQDLETEVAWRNRSNAAINEERTTVGAAVEDVAGVVSARVVETPGYIRTIVNDIGSTADNNEIAAAILASKAQGVLTLGAASGTALDDEGESVTINFDRVVQVDTHVIVNLSAPGGVSTTAVKAAIAAKYPTTSGKPVVWSALVAAVQAVGGVSSITSLLLGRTDPPSAQASLSADVIEQLVIDAADIDVNVV